MASSSPLVRPLFSPLFRVNLTPLGREHEVSNSGHRTGRVDKSAVPASPRRYRDVVSSFSSHTPSIAIRLTAERWPRVCRGGDDGNSPVPLVNRKQCLIRYSDGILPLPDSRLCEGGGNRCRLSAT